MKIYMTDHQGNPLVSDEMLTRQPDLGSVVITEGEWGTAWQRFFSDGLWHPTRGGGRRTWDQLIQRRNLVLVYDASERPEAHVVWARQQQMLEALNV